MNIEHNKPEKYHCNSNKIIFSIICIFFSVLSFHRSSGQLLLDIVYIYSIVHQIETHKISKTFLDGKQTAGSIPISTHKTSTQKCNDWMSEEIREHKVELCCTISES